jgi:hypothetical protein
MEVHATCEAEFNFFSPTKVFAPVGSNRLDQLFQEAGQPSPAVVRAFGIVLSDRVPPRAGRPSGQDRIQDPGFARISTPTTPPLLPDQVAVIAFRSTAHSANRSPTVPSPDGCWSMVVNPVPAVTTVVALATPNTP